MTAPRYVGWRRKRDTTDPWTKLPETEGDGRTVVYNRCMDLELTAGEGEWEYCMQPVGVVPDWARTQGQRYSNRMLRSQ